jgi:hypothetical protein
MKKYTIISLFAALLFFNTSCDDYLDVNINIDAPDENNLPDYLYLSGVEATLQDIYTDIRHVGGMTNMISSSSNYAAHYYSTNSDTGALIWRTTYFNHGMNLDNMIKSAIASKHWHLAGIGYVLRAFGWDMLAKLYADAPLNQFLQQGISAFDYNYQPDLYTFAQESALTGIKYLEMEDNATASLIKSYDYIYSADVAKWTKFAYGILVRNLVSLSNKKDFNTKYAPKIVEYAAKSFASSADDALLKVAGGSSQVPYDMYNNVFGTYNNYLGISYCQTDYAMQVMIGAVPKIQLDGDRVDRIAPEAPKKTVAEGGTQEEWNQFYKDSLLYVYYPWELEEKQIVASALNEWMWQPGTTVTKTYVDGKPLFTWTKAADAETGNYDPRVMAKLGTLDDPIYNLMSNADLIQLNRFYGGSSSTSLSDPLSRALPTFYGRDRTITSAVKDESQSEPNDGQGRWIYHNEAPYILMTYAEIQLCLAETQWKLGDKNAAYAAFKEGVRGDIAFTKGQLKPGTAGAARGGDKITAATFQKLADEYLAGKFVDGLGADNLELSHIMMQKWVALYPWGAFEAWTDMRKYHYDIKYTGVNGGVPSAGDGWDTERYITMKDEADKVYKGFYLRAARDIEFCNSTYSIYNEGSPAYRIRPRYNSEYVWNRPKLEVLKPISGTADNFQCSIPWFAYPDDAEYNKLTGYTAPEKVEVPSAQPNEVPEEIANAQ